jgi:hypothetical protein
MFLRRQKKTNKRNTVIEGETNRHNSVAELLKAQSNTETGKHQTLSLKN